jgi:hypothetical protein
MRKICSRSGKVLSSYIDLARGTFGDNFDEDDDENLEEDNANGILV